MALRLPRGMARPYVGTNPNPALITAEMWEFAACVVSLEPGDFENAGIYADKSGYHNTVTRNLSRWPGEYSTRLAPDLMGPRDKARAFDCKSRQAASGAAPVIMARYGARMRAAAKAHDPRVRYWREVLGQFDTDRAPEAIDFQSTAERVPDSTHEWHIHWSILTAYVALPEAYEGMLSVLYGESLDSWHTRNGGTDDMDVMIAQDNAGALYRVEGGCSYPLAKGVDLASVAYVIGQRGGAVARPGTGADMREWTTISGVPVRKSWSAEIFGATPAPAVNVAALADALRVSLGALDLGLDEADVASIVAALKDDTAVPLGAADMPAIEAALRHVLTTGTGAA